MTELLLVKNVEENLHQLKQVYIKLILNLISTFCKKYINYVSDYLLFINYLYNLLLKKLYQKL